MILDTIKEAEWIPKVLLDEFLKDIWFGVTHIHTYIRPRCVHLETFQMRPQNFSLAEAAFHTKVASWPWVACESTKGRYR